MVKVPRVDLICDVCGQNGARDVTITIDAQTTRLDACDTCLGKHSTSELIKHGKASVLPGSGVVPFGQVVAHLRDQRD